MSDQSKPTKSARPSARKNMPPLSELKKADELPIFPDMAKSMKVDFVFNREGKVWILHDKPLPAILKWVEFDTDFENVTLVTREGKLQHVGLKVPADMAYYIEQAMEITVMLMDNGKVKDFAIVPMITRNIALH